MKSKVKIEREIQKRRGGGESTRAMTDGRESRPSGSCSHFTRFCCENEDTRFKGCDGKSLER